MMTARAADRMYDAVRPTRSVVPLGSGERALATATAPLTRGPPTGPSATVRQLLTSGNLKSPTSNGRYTYRPSQA